MNNKKLSTAELYQIIQRLELQVETLTQENADLKLLLEITTDHGDLIITYFLKLLEKLKIEKQNQQIKAMKLRSKLAAIIKDKTDLEILLEATVEHGDTVEEELHNRSIRDPLTGLFNRRYLEQFLVRAIADAAQNQHLIAIIMIDIDHFKNFNNTFGHDAGDLVLREVSHFLTQSIAEADIACRYGGEELTLIFPNADPTKIPEQADQIRLGVKQLQLQYRDQPLSSITLSLGIAYFPTHGSTWDTVLKAADMALYQAKAQGRDQVVLATD